MAQKVQVLLVCDLHDGSEVEGAETIAFGLDGSSYEIDVCDPHAAELRDAFAPFVGQARRAGRSSSSAASSSARRKAPKSGDADRISAIREWGRQNGHKVSERGRLSASLTEAYDAAH
jgi:hypothetical protein